MESAVKLAELVKHRVPKLYQVNQIINTIIVDEYEPLEEGLDQLKFERNVTMISITLSKTPLDTNDIGYQEPIPDSEVQPFDERPIGVEGREPRERKPRDENAPRGGRGQRGGFRGGFRGRFRGGRGGFRGERREGGYREQRPDRYQGERREERTGGEREERTGGEREEKVTYDRPPRRYNEDRYDSDRRPRSQVRAYEDRPRRGGYE